MYNATVIISPLQVSDTLQPRRGHSSTAIQTNPTLTEVVMFGGLNDDRTILADTTVLKFSELCGVCRMRVDEDGKV